MLKKAILENGRVVKYFPDIIGEGSLKQAYLTKDKQSVICFYKASQIDSNRLHRLHKIIGEFNPTLAGKQHADYWNQLFCWPSGIVIKPQLGIIMPIYPPSYFFTAGRWQGKEKKGRWFISPKLRQYLPKIEQGTWIDYFKISILLVRAVSRLHFSGLAHSDLSANNVLIDPHSGQMMIIDIDSLVVPAIFPPDVDGTPGYIAPEVVASSRLSIYDPQKNLASIRTDQHALAVLIYEYLLNRHPLQGPKINDSASVEEDEYLSMGKKALFIENPDDSSNCPQQGVFPPMRVLGPQLTPLFYQAFITGLHEPYNRPSAYEWEKALVKTWNSLFPCPNKNCSHQWFIIQPVQSVIICPFCRTIIEQAFPIFILYLQNKPGQWIAYDTLVIYHGQSIFKWHVFDNIFPGPGIDKELLAYCVLYQGKWQLVNQNLESLTVLHNGRRVDTNQAVILRANMQMHFSQKEHAYLIDVKMINV